MKPKRNGGAEPQTEARRARGNMRMLARGERAVCEVERVRSSGGQGRPAAPWSEAKPRVGHGGLNLLRSPFNRESVRCSGNAL
jgi:hypothetical protein